MCANLVQTLSPSSHSSSEGGKKRGGGKEETPWNDAGPIPRGTGKGRGRGGGGEKGGKHAVHSGPFLIVEKGEKGKKGRRGEKKRKEKRRRVNIGLQVFAKFCCTSVFVPVARGLNGRRKKKGKRGGQSVRLVGCWPSSRRGGVKRGKSKRKGKGKKKFLDIRICCFLPIAMTCPRYFYTEGKKRKKREGGGGEIQAPLLKPINHWPGLRGKKREKKRRKRKKRGDPTHFFHFPKASLYLQVLSSTWQA